MDEGVAHSQSGRTERTAEEVYAAERNPWLQKISRYEWRLERARNYLFVAGNGKARIVHFQRVSAKNSCGSGLHQAAKPCDQSKKLAQSPGEPELEHHFHTPGVAAMTARHSSGTPDNWHPHDERGSDGWRRKLVSRSDDDDQCYSCQSPRSRLHRQRPQLYWHQEVPLQAKSRLACDATSSLRYSRGLVTSKYARPGQPYSALPRTRNDGGGE